MAQHVLAGTDQSLNDDASAFCESLGLRDKLEKAIELAKGCFALVGDPTIDLEQDPEAGESYLVVAIRVEGEEAACARSFESYMRVWTNSVEWPDVHLIRLIYRIT